MCRPVSAPAYRREAKPAAPPPPPPVRPSQNIITNHLPLDTRPRPTHCSLERDPPPRASPVKPSIREVNETRDRAAAERDARVLANNQTRIDKPSLDGISHGAACIPGNNAPSSWMETTTLQANRDVAYRGHSHDVEAHYNRRRSKDTSRDAARVNNRFVRTDHIRQAADTRRGSYNILTGQVEERRSAPQHMDVPLVTPRH